MMAADPVVKSRKFYLIEIVSGLLNCSFMDSQF